MEKAILMLGGGMQTQASVGGGMGRLHACQNMGCNLFDFTVSL